MTRSQQGSAAHKRVNGLRSLVGTVEVLQPTISTPRTTKAHYQTERQKRCLALSMLHSLTLLQSRLSSALRTQVHISFRERH